jgi:hypothetical protein
LFRISDLEFRVYSFSSFVWGRVASTGEVSHGIASRAVINSQNWWQKTNNEEQVLVAA